MTSSTQAVTAIAKRREAERDAEAPRGILRKPTDQFPEPEGFIREGAQPHKDRHAELLAQGLDPQARWTKVSRDIINPRALEIGLERFEILNEDEIVILRVMTPSELESFAKLTAAIREQERLQAREERRQKRKQLAIEGPPSGTDGAGAGPEQAGPKERKFRFAEGTKMGDGEVENSQAPAAKARARDMEDERRAEPSKLLAPVGTEYRPRDLEAEREHGPRRDRDEGPVERERSPRQERDRDDNRKHRERSPLPPPGPDSEDREPERHGSFVVPPAGTMSMSGMPPPPMDMNRLMPPMPPGPSGNRSGSRRNSNEPTQVRPVFSPEPEQLDRSRGGFIPPPAGSTFNSNSLSSSSDVGRGSSTSTYLPPNHSQPLNVSGGGGIAGQGGLGPPMPPPPPQPPVAMTVASSSSGYSDDGRSHDRRRGDDRERDDRRGRRERDHGREHGRERDREGERSRESDDRDERDDRHGGHDGRHRSERDHEKDRGRDEMDDLAD